METRAKNRTATEQVAQVERDWLGRERTKRLATEITKTAAGVAEQDALFREQVDACNQYEAGVLRAVLEQLRPALPALGGKVKGGDWRGLHLGNSCYLVTASGEIARPGDFWRVLDDRAGRAIPIPAEGAIEAVGLGNILEAINRALGQQLRGAKRRRTKEARERARLLEAVAVLVEGYETPTGLQHERAVFLKASRIIGDACRQTEALEPKRRLWVLAYMAERAVTLLQELASEVSLGPVACFEGYLNGDDPIGAAVKALDGVSEWHPSCMQLVDALAAVVYELEEGVPVERVAVTDALQLAGERFVKGADSPKHTERRVALLEEILTAAIRFAREEVTAEQIAAPLKRSNGRKARNGKVRA
jgi:hypothetical protein